MFQGQWWMGEFYLHLHVGTNRQAVPAALVDGCITVWKEKQHSEPADGGDAGASDCVCVGGGGGG